MLTLARHIPAANSSIKAGRWDKSRLLGIELHGKVLGIIGLGKIGKEVAQRAKSLGMRVIACDPFLSTKQGQQVGVTLHSKEEVLQRADFVTLHATLANDESGTRRLLGARELQSAQAGCLPGELRTRQPDRRAGAAGCAQLRADWQEWRSMSSARNPSAMIQS